MTRPVCRFGERCGNADCPYAHPSPAATKGESMVLSSEACTKGRSCDDATCTRSHPSPAIAEGRKTEICRYFPHCRNARCLYIHPQQPCRFGPLCKNAACPYLHKTDVKCRFQPCKNPHCIYAHEEGQHVPSANEHIASMAPIAPASDNQNLVEGTAMAL